jgi:hypothetical protein
MMAETRRIAAILAADVVGFSRMTSADEDGTLARLRAFRAVTAKARHREVAAGVECFKATGVRARVECGFAAEALASIAIAPFAKADQIMTKEAEPFSPEWLNRLSEEDRKALHKSPFAKDMHFRGAAHATWFIWVTNRPCPETGSTFQQASAFLLDCGKGPFVITAAHVYTKYLKDKAELGVQGCQIGNRMFEPDSRLIECGKEKNSDIASFTVTTTDIAGIGKQIVQGSAGVWPSPPNPRELVFIGGFPAASQTSMGEDKIMFGIYGGMTPVTSHTEYQIKSIFDRSSWIDTLGTGLPEQGYDLGGMSGGPMLVPDYKNGVWGWRLGGVISEAKSNADYEIITAVRAHHILPDGHLRM